MRFIPGCAALAGALLIAATPVLAQTNNSDKPTWWAKYQYLAANGPDNCAGQPGIKVGTNVDVSSNEHDCNGDFPCSAIDDGNQTGDYAGLASFGGVSYPMWTDSRNQLRALPGCRTGLAMEDVFTAAVSSKR